MEIEGHPLTYRWKLGPFGEPRDKKKSKQSDLGRSKMTKTKIELDRDNEATLNPSE